MKRFWKIIIRSILVLFVLLNTIVAFHAYKFTHFYDRDANTPAANIKKSGWAATKEILFGITTYKQQNIEPDSTFEKVILTTKDKIKIEGWYIKTNNTAKGTVILFHGHGSRKTSVLHESEGFRQLGYNTLLIDFRAHGGSGGNTCTIGYEEGEEVKQAFDFIKERGEKNIVLWGISMGAAAITKSMYDYHLQPSKVILEMPFASLWQAAEGRVKLMKLPGEPLGILITFWGGALNGIWAFNHKPAVFAGSIQVPALVQWGRKDPRVMQEETEAVYHALAGKKQLVVYETAGHESLCDKEHEKWMSSIADFLNQ